MYKFLFSQQLRHSNSISVPMNTSQLILTLMFCFNSWIYLHFDDQMRIAQGIQGIIAIASIIFMIYYGFTSQSIPYVISTLLTGILLTVSFYFNVDALFMIIPFVFFLSVDKILNKLKLILEVLFESLWMFISIMFCFCLFGLVSYFFFSKNAEYFNTPLQSSLTYLQVATLDEIGKISLQNFEKFGFLKSFGTMAASLGIIHLLININQAIIMQYVYSKRHNEEIASTRQELFGEARVELKTVRIINIIVTSTAFLFPFPESQGTLWLLLVFSIISTFTILLEHWFQSSVCSIRNISSILLQVVLIALFFRQNYNVFYLLYTGRIFLLSQVIKLWIKIWQVVWEISQLVSFSTIFFIVFTFLSYVLYKVETDKVKIEVVLIKGLQFMTLDDWTSNIRHAQWYMSLLTVVYVILLNHIILNALISQAFGELKVDDHSHVQLEEEADKFLKKEKKVKIEEVVSEEKSAEAFWRMANIIGYSDPTIPPVEVEIMNYQEVTHDFNDIQELGNAPEAETEMNDLIHNILDKGRNSDPGERRKQSKEKEVEMEEIK